MDTKDLNKLFAFNVRYLAKKNGLKIGDVEAALNRSPGYFSRLDHGNGNVSLDMAWLTARILKVSLDDLCTDIRLKEFRETAKELGYKLVKIESGPEVDDECDERRKNERKR